MSNNKDLALGYLASFASGDPDNIADRVTEDFVNDQPGALAPGCEGREVYRERLAGFLKAFKGLRYTPETVAAEGDIVSMGYRMEAESEGHPINIRGVMVVTLKDGLIAKRSDYWDGLTYLQQTGQK